MARAKATQVIEHRISLQDAERTAVLQPVGEILRDVQKFTETANTMRQVAVYGALGLSAAGLYYVPKVWSETTQLIAGGLNAVGGAAASLNPLTMPERFVDYWEDRNIPTGVIGDFFKGRGFFA